MPSAGRSRSGAARPPDAYATDTEGNPFGMMQADESAA